jgi:hypothetical protein
MCGNMPVQTPIIKARRGKDALDLGRPRPKYALVMDSEKRYTIPQEMPLRADTIIRIGSVTIIRVGRIKTTSTKVARSGKGSAEWNLR